MDDQSPVDTEFKTRGPKEICVYNGRMYNAYRFEMSFFVHWSMRNKPNT